MDRVDGIMFEGDAVRDWLKQLKNRAEGNLETGGKNTVVQSEWAAEYAELKEALEALGKAHECLVPFERYVQKREAAA